MNTEMDLTEALARLDMAANIAGRLVVQAGRLLQCRDAFVDLLSVSQDLQQPTCHWCAMPFPMHTEGCPLDTLLAAMDAYSDTVARRAIAVE